MGTKASQFRMTLWFKKGEFVDDVPAGDDTPSAKLLPIEDRYLDDGSVTGEDSRMFSLHSGRTQHVEVVDDAGRCEDGDDLERMQTVVNELKRGRRTVVAALGGLAAVGAVVMLYVL